LAVVLRLRWGLWGKGRGWVHGQMESWSVYCEDAALVLSGGPDAERD
jgi:hypothetical protein